MSREVTRIVWSDEFELGHEELDNEHRLFVDLINATYTGAHFSWLRARLNSLLDDIYHLAELHFSKENAILLRINRSPLPSDVKRSSFIRAVIEAAFDNHIANHAQTLRELGAIISDIRSELSGIDPHLNSDLGEWRAGSGCLNSFAPEISGLLPGLVPWCDAPLACNAGRA